MALMPGFEPKPHWWVASDVPCPMNSLDTHARGQPVTQSAQSRRSYRKIPERDLLVKAIRKCFQRFNAQYEIFGLSPAAVSHSNDFITKFYLRQSAFCIEFFNANIKIPET